MKFYWFLPIVTVLFIGCSKPSAEEMFNKGVDSQRASMFNDAIEAYNQLISTYPDSARTPEALYAIATIYQNHTQSYSQAIQTFSQFVEKYPDHPLAPSASFLIGFIYNNDLKNIDSARIAYEQFLKSYPNSQLVMSAQFELETLGKDAGEILKERAKLAEAENKSAKKGKKK